MDSEIRLGLLNLHDAFLNADIAHREKWRTPVDEDPERFHYSDHARFERMWVMFLYVLVEAWQSTRMAPIRAYVDTVTATGELNRLLQLGETDGSVAKMRDARNYMCHRDRREYWDDGRLAVCGQLDYHMKLYAAFSQVLLAAMKSTNRDRNTGAH